MIEFYPILMNAKLIPEQIDSLRASLPVNNNCSQIEPSNKYGNNNDNENKDKIEHTLTTAITLSKCVGQTGKFK